MLDFVSDVISFLAQSYADIYHSTFTQDDLMNFMHAELAWGLAVPARAAGNTLPDARPSARAGFTRRNRGGGEGCTLGHFVPALSGRSSPS
jgi:hypothetical protein